MNKPAKEVLRMIDANLNRCREGYRVLEDVARFFMNNETLSASLKRQRHALESVFSNTKVDYCALLRSRDVAADFGKKPSALEKKRAHLVDVYAANAQRVKEALRSLEEFTKLIDPKAADGFKRLRFRFYETEKRSLRSLAALRHHRL